MLDGFSLSMEDLAWDKMDGMLPCVVQDRSSQLVLMLGYMNRAALEATLESGQVTFYSRSKQRLWRKGESSGNTLDLASLHWDCDKDALLAQVDPRGPTCHLGSRSCFYGDERPELPELGFLGDLSKLILERQQQRPEGSYTTRIFEKGVRYAAQKVGEEGVETALAAVAEDDEAFLGESADLLYHLIVTARCRGFGLEDIAAVLRRRQSQ